MTMARYSGVVQDQAGNIIPNAKIEVRRETPGAPLAALKDGPDGLVALTNPFNAESDGTFFFHVVGGFYKIRAYTGASGAPTYEKILRYVPVGELQGYDLDALLVGKRQQVRVATTANITIATALNNGDTIDGVTLATNDLVLVKNQTSKAENGVYVVGVTPARSAEFDTYNEHAGAMIAVVEGTAGEGSFWFCTANIGGTLGTTALDFTKIAATVGPVGPEGPQGPAGPVTVAVGTVTTLAAGEDATVTNSGDDENVILDFGIPEGADGPPGGVQSIVAGANISVDNTDPANPVVSTSGGGGGSAADYATKADVEAATIPGSLDFIRTAGYSAAGDGGGALYKRVVSEPSHEGKIESDDGAWWEIAEAYVSLTNLGAVGDDSSDNTGPIGDAIEVADALGIPLFVPPGIFRTAGPHDLPASLVVLGAGRFSSIIRTTSTTENVFLTDGDGISIKSVGFDSAVTRSAGSFLDVAHGLFELSDFRMSDPFIGVTLHSSSRTILFENGEVIDPVATTGIGMTISNSGTDLSINDVVFTISDAGARPASHIQIDLLGDLAMHDVQLYGAVNNMVLNPGSSESISSLKCVNVWFDGASSNGLLIQPSSTGTVKRSTFDSCWFGGCGNAGAIIYPDGASTEVDGIDFANCEFLGNTVAGLYTGGDDTIKNLQINGGRAAGNGAYGVLFDGVLSGSIQNIRVGACGGFSANGTGLSLDGAADNLNITGVDLRGNTSAVANSATGTNIRFVDVVGYEASISPSQITSSQNNYLPTEGHATGTWRLNSDASRNLTGIVAPGYAKELLIENVGSFNLVLVNASGSSSAANRFLFGGDVTVAPNFAARIKYDLTSQRWRLVSLSAALGTAASKNTGTSGDAVPLLNAANTWSMDQTIQGRLGVGAAGIDTRVGITIGPTLTSAGDVFGVFMGYASLGPGSGASAFFQYVGGGAVATGGNTIAAAYGLFSEAMTKSGGGTVTNSYSGYFKKSALATNNYGIYTDGESGIGANPAASAWLAVGAGTTSKSQINLASSTAPSAPNNGDIWFDGSALKIRIGGATKTVTVT